MRAIRTPNAVPQERWSTKTRGPWQPFTTFSGTRFGEEFRKGLAYVDDDAKAQRFVRDYGYVDVTDEERVAARSERQRLLAELEEESQGDSLVVAPTVKGRLP